MGDFLSPAAPKVIAKDHQHGLLDRLNEKIKGTNAVAFSSHTVLTSSLVQVPTLKI